MKKLMLLVVPFLLFACTSIPLKVELPAEAYAITTPVQDLRPENEKKSEIFSLMITSSGYGIYRRGDEILDPPMTDLFRWYIYEKLGGNNKDLKIIIHHMVVYQNSKATLVANALSAGAAVARGQSPGSGVMTKGGTLVNMSQKLVDRDWFENVKAEYQRAFYDQSENPTHAQVFIIYIDATVNDKRVFVRTIAPFFSTIPGIPLVQAIEAATQFYLEQYSLEK